VAKGADCKSAGLRLRRFESYLPHHLEISRQLAICEVRKRPLRLRLVARKFPSIYEPCRAFQNAARNRFATKMDDSDRAKADQKWIRNELRTKRLADFYSRHIDAEILEPMRRNFEVDKGREDPEAKRRLTRKEVRHELIRRTIAAYLANERVPKAKRRMKQAVSWVKDGFEKRYGVTLDERTIYEACRPSSRSRAKR
jgi:hypothetical protein